MDTPKPAGPRDGTGDGLLRRRFIFLASAFAVLALLHFVDHAVRGELVVNGGLDPDWNHSGWPFNTQSDKPYIFPISFVVVFGIVLGGIFFTVRGRLWAGYWLAASLALGALLVFVHFIGFSSGAAETPRVICRSYADTLPRILALTDLFGMFAVLAGLAFHCARARQRSGRW